jgi:CubicO group peptidase (beta-lactamase class C family)
MALADEKAEYDTFLRSLLVVKNGYLVYEKYFGGGQQGQSTEVWSVTKSFTSALVGIAIDEGYIEDVDDLMVDYMPQYPEFQDVTIRHVLTHTTGLEWTEQGDEFVAWIESDDWIGNAVRRERLSRPGQVFLYSSGNSHFLSGLIKSATGKTPGEYAREHIFDPLGIAFDRLTKINSHPTWDDFMVRRSGTWKQDSKGLEVGAFGLHLTAREMAKFGYLFLNKGKWGNKTILSERWIEESTRDHVLRSDNFGFGFQWVVSERGGQLAFNADGWGGQIICVIPALDMVVVIKSDSENPGVHPYYAILASVIEAAA